MAVTRDDLIIAIQADTAKASKSLQELKEQMSELTSVAKGTQKGVSGFGASMLKVAGGLAVAQAAMSAVSKVVGTTVGAFLEAEEVSKRLSRTLAFLGERDVKKTAERFQTLAKTLETTTKADGDHILKLTQLAKTTGLTNDQTEKLITTTVDLAAATGKGLDEAFDGLLKTFKGTAGAISVLEPSLKNLTEEQLRNGKAIDLMSEKYRGFAKDDAKGLMGALAQTKTFVGDVFEGVGEIISKSFNLDELALRLRDFTKVTADFIEKNKAMFIAFVSNIKDAFMAVIDALEVGFNTLIIGVAIPLKKAFDFLGMKDSAETLNSLIEITAKNGVETAEKLANRFTTTAEVQKQLNEETEKYNKTLQETADKNRKVRPPSVSIDAQETKKLLDELSKRAEEISKKSAEAGLQGVTLIRARSTEELKSLSDFEKKLSDAFKGTIPLAAQHVIEQARINILLGQQNEIRTENLKTLESLGKENESLASQVALFDADAKESARIKLQMQLDLVEAKRMQLESEGKLTEEAQNQLDRQRDLLKEKSRKEQQTGAGQVTEGLTKGLLSGVNSIAGVISKGGKVFSDGFVEKASKVTAGFADKISGFVGQFGGIIGGIVQFVAKLFDPEFINQIANFFGEFLQKLPEALSAAFDGLMKALDSFIEKFPEAFKKILDALPGMIDSFLKRLPAIIDVLFDALGQLIDAIPGIVEQLLNALPGLISKILDRLPDIIIKIFDAIPKIVTSIIEAIPQIVTSIVEKLPMIIESLVQGLTSAATKIVAAILQQAIKDTLNAPQMTKGLINMIVGIVKGIVMGVVNGMKDAFKDIFGGKKIKVPAEIKNLPDNIAKGFKKVAKGLQKDASRLFAVTDLQSAAKGEDVADRIQEAIDTATGRSVKKLNASWELLKKYVQEAWMFVWDKIINPFVSILKSTWAVITGVFRETWDGIVNVLKTTWEEVVASLQLVWSTLVEVTKTLWDGVKIIWDTMLSLLQGAWDGIKIIWNGMVSVLQGAWDGVKIIWDGMMAVLSGVWDGIKIVWDTMLSLLRGAWDSITGVFKDLWDGVKKIWSTLMDMFQGKIGFLDGVRQIFGTMFDTAGKVLGRVVDFFKSTFDTVGAMFSNLWESIKGIFAKVGETFQKLWDNAKSIFAVVTDTFQKLWDNGKAMFDRVAEAFQKLWDKAQEAFNKIGDMFRGLWESASRVFNSVGDALRGVWDTFKNGAGEIGSKIWDAIKNAFSGAGDLFGGIGNKIWEGLKRGLDGLGGFFSDLFSRLNPGNLFERIFNIDYRGKGTVENALNIDVPFANFAKGGLVPGMPSVPGDSVLNDKILAMLSPGEAVIPRSVMDNPALNAIVQAIIDGKLIVPNFRRGGVLGAVSRGEWKEAGNMIANAEPAQAVEELQNMADALDPRKLWEQVKDKVFGSIMEMFRANRFAQGGYVEDNIPAMLSNGEFVVSRGGVQAAGLGNLNAINQGRIPAGNVTNNYNFDVEMKITGSTDEAMIRNKIIPMFKEELRRASLDGQFVISKQGLR